MCTRPKSRSFAGLTLAAWILSSAAFLSLASCGGGGGSCWPYACSTPSPTIKVTPSHATLQRGGSRQLTASVQLLDDKRVTWSVQEGAAGGTVSQGGAYTAPSTPGVYHVVATASNGLVAKARIAVPAVFRSYALTDLGDFQPIAVNSLGQVAGQSGEFTRRAAIYQNGSIKELGTLGGDESWATDINDSGVIVGYSKTASGSFHAFLYDGAVMRDLGTLPGDEESRAAGVNNLGQVVGSSGKPEAANRGFLYSGGAMTSIGPSGATSTFANAINDSGQIVGTSIVGGVEHGFTYSGGSATLLREPTGFSSSQAFSVNNSGQITGLVGSSTGVQPNSLFLQTNGVLVDLGGAGLFTPGDRFRINNAGHIAGEAYHMGSFVYDGAIIQVVEDASGTPAYYQMSDIADNGSLVGWRFQSQYRRGTLLIPQ